MQFPSTFQRCLVHVDNTSCSVSTYFQPFSNTVALHFEHSMAYGIRPHHLIISRSCSNCGQKSDYLKQCFCSELLLWLPADVILLFFWIQGGYISLWWCYVLLMEGESLEIVIVTMSRNYHVGQCHVVTDAAHME